MDKDVEGLFKVIEVFLKHHSLPFDQTKDGRVVEIPSKNTYKVKIQDKIHTIKSEFHYSVGEKVSVTFKCGNEHNLLLHPNRPEFIVSETEPSINSVADSTVWIKT